MEDKIDTLLVQLKNCEDTVDLDDIVTALITALREAPNQVGHAHLWADPNDLDDHLEIVSNAIYLHEFPTAYAVLGNEGEDPEDNHYIGRLVLIDSMWHAFFAQLYLGCWDNANRAANEIGVACYG